MIIKAILSIVVFALILYYVYLFLHVGSPGSENNPRLPSIMKKLIYVPIIAIALGLVIILI